MGLSEEDDSRARSSSSDANEESLPLYAEHHDIPASDLTPPDPKATPDEVRAFLVQLLVSTRQFPLDHARRIASRWSRGTGREVDSYPPAMYFELFGQEDGWMLYKEAKLCIKKNKEKARKIPPRYSQYAFTVFGLVVEVLMGLVIAYTSQPLWMTLAIFVMLFFGIAFVGTVVGFFITDDPESEIESDLRKALEARGSNTQPESGSN